MNDYGEEFLVFYAEPQKRRREFPAEGPGNVSGEGKKTRKGSLAADDVESEGSAQPVASLSAHRRTQTPLDMAVFLLGLCPTVIFTVVPK